MEFKPIAKEDKEPAMKRAAVSPNTHERQKLCNLAVMQSLLASTMLILLSTGIDAQQSVVEVVPDQQIVIDPPTSVDLSGTWCGRWMSCKNGHHGRLRASFCRVDDCHVRATFKGTFAKVIPFRYPATLKIVDEQPGKMVLSGSQKLGPIMGSFNYQVTITPGAFSATYQSKRDWGTWTLQRQ